MTARTSLLAWVRPRQAKLANLARPILFLFVLLVACPIRYWPLGNSVDPTWRFLLNYAPAHGYVSGRDYANTTGPLVYLIFPLNLGHNLAQGLFFQGCLWVALGAIFGDVMFRGGFRTRNLALFCLFFSLAAPLFWYNGIGTENLMLAGVLLLLVMFQLHGGWIRYAAALVLLGLLPLFKMSAGLIGASALIGFLAERLIERRSRAWPELLLAAVLPLTIAGSICAWLIPSMSALLNSLRASAEVMSGYSSAMSLDGPPGDFLLAAEATLVLLAALCLWQTEARTSGRFYALLLAGPFVVSLKHGFVRQDAHVSNFICFIALALALIALTASLRAGMGPRILPAAIAIALIWQSTPGNDAMRTSLPQVFGIAGAEMLAGIFPYQTLGQRIDSYSVESIPKESRLEPELIAVIGNSPVASLSPGFTNLALAGLQLTLYPSGQRFSGDTAWLDRWDATWVQEKGPRFLVFDGKTIDERDAWAETPAMWLEIYRWYDTRALGPRNLLLERRATPRFSSLESIGRTRSSLSGKLQLPASADPVFWTMKCSYTTGGLIRKTLARVPAVTMVVHETEGATRRPVRVIPELLTSPMMGNYLPADLAQFAAVFGPGPNWGYSIDEIQFGGEGAASYGSSCDVELLRPVR